jgi:F-BAR domain only protein
LLESIGPNRIFVSATDASKPDEFTIDTSHLSKTSPAFTYRVHAGEDSPNSLAKHVPLLIRPAWKPTGDKLGLLLQYRLNETWTGPKPVTLSNVVFVATYESAVPAAGAQTKPSGTHLKEKKLVYWRMGDVTLGGEEWGKIVCRIVGAENAEVKPGSVEARWEYAVSTGGSGVENGDGISVSRWVESKGKGKEEAEADPFADDGTPATDNAAGSWVGVPLVKKLVSGKYEAK